MNPSTISEALTIDAAECIPAEVERDLARLETRLTEAHDRYARPVTNSGYNDDLKAVAERVNRPDLDAAEAEVAKEAAALHATLHAAISVTENVGPSLSDAEMGTAANHLPFVERQAAKSSLPALIEGVKHALAAGVGEPFDVAVANRDYYFGRCPECRRRFEHRTHYFRNVGRNHWHACDEHRIKCWGGENMFSGWRDEDPAVWEANAELLAGYREVDTIYEPDVLHDPYDPYDPELEGDRA